MVFLHLSEPQLHYEVERCVIQDSKQKEVRNNGFNEDFKKYSM